MITATPTTDRIASCNGCGQVNYTDTRVAVQPNGVHLTDVSVGYNGHRTTLRYCRQCLLELSDAVYPYRNGR